MTSIHWVTPHNWASQESNERSMLSNSDWTAELFIAIAKLQAPRLVTSEEWRQTFQTDRQGVVMESYRPSTAADGERLWRHSTINTIVKHGASLDCSRQCSRQINGYVRSHGRRQKYERTHWPLIFWQSPRLQINKLKGKTEPLPHLLTLKRKRSD